MLGPRIQQSICILIALILLSFTDRGNAAVVVLTNRTLSSQSCTLIKDGKNRQYVSLAAGTSRPYFYDHAISVELGDGISKQSFQLSESSIYAFVDSPRGGAELEKIGLSPQDYETAKNKSQTNSTFNQRKKQAVITVKLLVDDDEPTHRSIWETRLKDRIHEASKVIEQHSGIQLKVVAVETWESNDREHDFARSLSEFERTVKPHPAQVAIGFSSQYQIEIGRVHMGGTRGPLYPYILLKERAPRMMESERLELLVHELGHFLAASHSPEANSVMRPLLSGGQQRRQGAQIRVDPVNTLLMAMTGDELRNPGVTSIKDFSRSTRERMMEIYGMLTKAIPEDPAAGHFQQMFSRISAPPVVEDARLVLRGLIEKANELHSSGSLLSGDALTNYYVRQAAITALQVPSEHRAKSFLLALGIFMDESTKLRILPATTKVVLRIESDLEWRQRIKVMGNPTFFNRGDLSKHFFVSAHLLVVMGSQASRTAGLAKEMLDARQGTGFSFADMAANRAGIIFAERLINKKLSLEQVAREFRVSQFMPPIDNLDEGLRLDALQERFGGAEADDLESELAEIEQSIYQLPGYSDFSTNALKSAK